MDKQTLKHTCVALAILNTMEASLSAGSTLTRKEL